MRSIWILGGVFLFAAVACATQRRYDIALIFAAIGFELVFVADSDFDWQRRITRKNWQQSIFEQRWKSTILAKVSQWLAFVCLFLWFVVTIR